MDIASFDCILADEQIKSYQRVKMIWLFGFIPCNMVPGSGLMYELFVRQLVIDISDALTIGISRCKYHILH